MTYLVRRGSKYGATSTIYKGISYHSKKEAGYAQLLDTCKKAVNPSERVLKWERQIPIELRAPTGELICKYYCDFKVWYADGSVKLVEVKGFTTEVFRLKLKLLELLWLPQHPEIEYEIIR